MFSYGQTPADPLQTTTEVAADNSLQTTWSVPYQNHVIRINQQAGILVDMFKKGVIAGVNPPEARDAAQNLKNLAIRYTQAVQNKSSLTELEPLFENMMLYYNKLVKNYVDKNYIPIKKIRESLMYIWGENSKVNQELSLNLNITPIPNT